MNAIASCRGARTTALLAAVLLGATPAAARAQGSVGTQGFGYPTGQLSTRAEGTAGAVVPFDAESPVNPAALGRTGPAALHVQYAPEFRTVRIGGASERTTLSRFPLITANLPVGSLTVLGLSASTVLDRSFATTATVPQQVADTTIQAVQTRRSTGGITDVRIAAARGLASQLTVGVAVHGYTGENRVTVHLADDSARFIVFDDSVRLNYSGLAASAGFDWRPAKGVSLAGSYKRGGTLRVRDDATDRVLGEGRVPDRLGGGLLYERIAGTALAASAGWERWSAMNDLGTSAVGARDVFELSVGADARGPRFGQGAMALRAGVGWRELPFPVPGAGNADELTIGIGAGLPLAYNRATLDLGLRRASRSAGDARETAWMASIGLSVRP